MKDEALFCTAVIEGEALVLRVPFTDIPKLVEGAWALGSLDQRFKVTNEKVFAEALEGELNKEDEEGTTLIHKMFDAAINEALEQGAEGIEEHEDQED